MGQGMNLALAERLVALCGDLNDGFGCTHKAGNVEARIILPGDLGMPPGVPAGTPLVLFAGSNDWGDWKGNADTEHAPFGFGMGGVHKGFLGAWVKILPQILEAIEPFEAVCLSGHSQGGAIASLASADLKQRGRLIPWVYTFGSPRPASKQFRDSYRSLGIPNYRVVVGFDVVARCPDRSCDYHVGKGYFFTEDGDPRPEQPRPKWYTPWRYLTDSVWSHIALSSYLTALRRAQYVTPPEAG